MARQVVKLDFAKENPPMRSGLIGQTAYVQGLGSNAYTPGKNPQPMYVENALPTTNGWQSVGFTSVLAANLAGFDEIYRVQDSTGAMGLVSPAGGMCYLWKMGSAGWTAKFAAGAFGAVAHNSSLVTVGSQSFISLTSPSVPAALDPKLLANLNAAQTALNAANAYVVYTPASAWFAGHIGLDPVYQLAVPVYWTAPVGWGLGSPGFARTNWVTFTQAAVTPTFIPPAGTSTADMATYNGLLTTYNNAYITAVNYSDLITGTYFPVLGGPIFIPPAVSTQFNAYTTALYNAAIALHNFVAGLITTLATTNFNAAQAAYNAAVAGIAGVNGNLGIYQIDVSNVANWKHLWMFKQTAIGCTLNSTINVSRTTGSFITDGWLVGMGISGSGIPAGATIATVAALTLTLSVAATLTGTVDVSVSKADGISGLSTLSGSYALGSILGFISSGNYLIAYDTNTIYWSSTTNVLDFTPSLITGAGSAVPTDLQGNITACVPITNGFLILTTEGILSAQYSGNATYPWIFKAVAGGGPVIGIEAISHDLVDDTQVGWTSSGLCTVNANQCTVQEAEISDFLKGDAIESFDLVKNIPVTTLHIGQKVVKVTRVSSRYLILSYAVIQNPQIFTHAIIYDTVLKRAGRLVTPHVELFLWPYAFSATTAKIAVCRANGSIDLVDPYAVVQQGVLIFGRIALTRNSNCTIQYAEIEGCNDVRVMPLLDGVTMNQVIPMQQVTPGVFNTRVTAKSHNLLFKAPFDLTYGEVALHQAGNR